MYNFVLFVQKEISPTRLRKIIFDHLITLIKVDREDHFQRPGFPHSIICVFLGYKALDSVEKIGCYRC